MRETEGKETMKEEKKKKGGGGGGGVWRTALSFAISSEPAVEMRRGKKQSWSTRRELRVGTRNYGFRHVPKCRGFSYTVYFLPSSHVRAILVQL